MFEDFNYKVTNIVVFDNLFFKVLSADFFDSGCLSQLFSLVKHLQVVIQELVDEFLQVFLNLVEHDQFSGLIDVGSFFEWSTAFDWNQLIFIAWTSQRYATLWIDDGHEGYDFRKLVQVEVFLRLLLVVAVVDIKNFLILLKHSRELVDVATHVKLGTIHEDYRLLVLVVAFTFKYPT